MHEDTIFSAFSASLRSPNQVMFMPSRELGDLLVADRADPFLLFPQEEQRSFLNP
jgi:hypothetical protein